MKPFESLLVIFSLFWIGKRQFRRSYPLDDIRHLIFEKELYDKVSVLEMMQPPPALIQMGQDTMNQVMDKFQNTAAWNLPVVKNGKYIGFISKSKLLTVYRRKLIYFSNNK